MVSDRHDDELRRRGRDEVTEVLGKADRHGRDAAADHDKERSPPVKKRRQRPVRLASGRRRHRPIAETSPPSRRRSARQQSPARRRAPRRQAAAAPTESRSAMPPVVRKMPDPITLPTTNRMADRRPMARARPSSADAGAGSTFTAGTVTRRFAPGFGARGCLVSVDVARGSPIASRPSTAPGRS